MSTNNSNSNKPTTIVIFGASGDLTQRKLIPALFSLYRKSRMPAHFHIVGASRTPLGDEGFRKEAREGVDQYANYKFSADEWGAFAQNLFYCAGDYTQGDQGKNLALMLAHIEGEPANRLYYLAMPPKYFPSIVRCLGAAGMTHESEGFRRVVIEKPFGTDLKSARELTNAMYEVLSEQQIYRIDHYLGKETVQNVLIFRFANGIFEPIWNRNYIDHVQITVAEKESVGHRAGYYDGVGVLRDMFQNHLLALMALVAMEPPASFSSTALRNERAKVLTSIRPIPPIACAQNTVRGQYRGYRAEPGVAPDSRTATYAALRLFIDNWRWQDVPFYLRSGKNLVTKTTEIMIQFKSPPQLMFPAARQHDMTPNMLALCLQPDEGIHLRFEAKTPDTVADMRSVNMAFHYKDSFGVQAIPEAYERLLLDALNGDASLFIRNDQIELAWELIDPIIAAWQTPDGPPLDIYEPGSWGPKSAEQFMAVDERQWFCTCGGIELS
jgi:glucose-6-phosphate 1-dehydrogenase